MDKALFEFRTDAYSEKEVMTFSRHTCEHLSNSDEDNVTKFDLNANSIESLLNNDMLDTDNCWVRIFTEESDKSNRYKINSPDECGCISIKITKDTYPIIYQDKMAELIEEGLSEEEAENVVNGMTISLELMYQKGSGLFGIETDAVESCASNLFNPYTGDHFEDWDEDEY